MALQDHEFGALPRSFLPLFILIFLEGEMRKNDDLFGLCVCVEFA
jgi:hypothetical protein